MSINNYIDIDNNNISINLYTYIMYNYIMYNYICVE